jgi:hypothetical protein
MAPILVEAPMYRQLLELLDFFDFHARLGSEQEGSGRGGPAAQDVLEPQVEPGVRGRRLEVQQVGDLRTSGFLVLAQFHFPDEVAALAGAADRGDAKIVGEAGLLDDAGRGFDEADAVGFAAR